MTRKTKIIATVGPSVYSKDGIKKLVNAGADVLMINTRMSDPTEIFEFCKKYQHLPKQYQ